MTDISKSILEIERQMMALSAERDALRAKAKEIGYEPSYQQERLKMIQDSVKLYEDAWRSEKLSLLCYINGKGNLECSYQDIEEYESP